MRPYEITQAKITQNFNLNSFILDVNNILQIADNILRNKYGQKFKRNHEDKMDVFEL